MSDFGRGGMLFAEQARVVGMVDRVGTLDVALDVALRMGSARIAETRRRRLALLSA